MPSSDNGITLRTIMGLWRDRPEGSLELQEALRLEWGGR